MTWTALGKRILVGFLIWTLVAVFFASELYFAGLPWGQALSWSIPRAYSWALLTPAVFWVDRRIGRAWALQMRVASHVVLAAPWATLAILLRLFARPLRGSPWPEDLRGYYLDRIYSDILIYVAVVAVSIVRDYSEQIRDREQRAREAAVRAAELERSLAEAKFQSLRAQVQPHFLFNALNTISAFTETNPQMARRLMAQLGDLLRASLAHFDRPLIPLSEELTFLDDYLAIESARFEGRITVSVQADDDVLDRDVPSMLLQPVVENAIRHGVAPRRSGGHIDVTARRAGSSLRLQITDDGVGLAEGWTLDRNAGVGLRNVASRLEHLYNRGDLLQVRSRPAGGVDVQIDVPLEPATIPDAGRVS